MQTHPTIENIDLCSPAFIADPYPAYHRLRELDRPFWLPFDSHGNDGIWLFSRYEDANIILKEAKKTSNDITPYLPENFASPLQGTILQSDPPKHTRLRKIISEYFKLKTLDSLKPHIVKVIDDSLAQIEADVDVDVNFDFMNSFANKVPLLLAAEMIGIPEQDHQHFFNWSRQLTAGLDYMTGNDDVRHTQKIALNKMKSYFSEWLDESHQHPENTFTHELLQIHRNTDNLNKTELLSMLVLFLIAGHENITSTLGNGMLALLNNPQQKLLLTKDLQHMGSAVEEVLRYESPLQRSSLRVATDEFQICNHTCKPGDKLSVIIGSANRDPRQFETPEKFDILRKPNRHLTFGTGPHVCVGAALARMHVSIAFSRIFQRWPHIQLVNEQPQWRHSTIFRGLQSLPLRLE